MCTARDRRRRHERRAGADSPGSVRDDQNVLPSAPPERFGRIQSQPAGRHVSVFDALPGARATLVSRMARPRFQPGLTRGIAVAAGGDEAASASRKCAVVGLSSTFVSEPATGADPADSPALQGLATNRRAFSAGMCLAQRLTGAASRATAPWRVSTCTGTPCSRSPPSATAISRRRIRPLIDRPSAVNAAIGSPAFIGPVRNAGWRPS